MAQYFVSSLDCPANWIGFVGAETLDDLFWAIDAQGLDPYGAIFRKVDDSEVGLFIPVRTYIERGLEEAGEGELIACPSLATDQHSLGNVALPEAVFDIYDELMQLVLNDERSDAWVVFESEDELQYHYESERANRLMAIMRDAMSSDAAIQQSEPCWWTPVDSSKLDSLLGVPVFVKSGDKAHHSAVQLVKKADEPGYWWELLSGTGEVLPLERVTAFMYLEPQEEA